ncbi:MAG: YccF domain-containing protein [Gemmatimonadaceae bacterium]
MLTLILNILWFIFGGFFAWLGWMFGGVLLAISIVGWPFAFAAFRIAGFAAFPFGKQLVDARDVGDTRVVGTGIANVLWFIFAGVWLFIAHVAAGIALCLTIIGIPFGLAHFKLAMVSLAPLGKRTVTSI